MRYRPLGSHGQVVSAVSLVLEQDGQRRRPGDWVALIYAALECGISCFQIPGSDAALGDAVAEAFSSIDRQLVFVALDLGGRRPRATFGATTGEQVKDALSRTRLDYLDAVLLDPSAAADARAVRELAALKSAGVVRALGVSGDGGAVDALVASGGLDLLATGYSLLSGAAERGRLRTAIAAGMAVLGYGYYPTEQLDPLRAPQKRDRKNPLAGMGGYRFLDETRDWTAEELCLAYALAEPALATVQVSAGSIEQLERLAAVADRELPSGVAAQIEMARFSTIGQALARRSA